MKILWITEFFPESDKGEITGGVESRCFYVSRYLRKLGHDVKIISQDGVGNWLHTSFKSVPKRLIFMINATIRALREDFDLVEGTDFITHMVARFVGTIKRKPVIFWYPDVFIGSWKANTGSVGALGELLEKINLLTPPDCYIAISKSTKNKLISLDVPENKIHVVYCGVEPNEILSIKKFDHKTYDICCVNRLVSYKRTEDLIRAIAILAQDFPKISLAIVGQGPEKKPLVALVKSLYLDHCVKFFDHLPNHSDVLQIMSQSKIFCLPSEVEGFGIVIVEASSLGVPFVASNIPVIKEISQNGKGGLLFETRNHKDLAQKLSNLLDNKSLYSQKKKEAVALAKNYTWEKIAQETEKVYENLLSH